MISAENGGILPAVSARETPAETADQRRGAGRRPVEATREIVIFRYRLTAIT
jgi:hypothetical protein